jgi:hypothetical protein
VACQKRTYRRQADAHRTLKAMRKRVPDPFRLTVYWCELHGGWHIGNTPLSSDARRVLQARKPDRNRSDDDIKE